MYHLVAFDLEQATKFYLKYFLFRKLKQFPPTHSLRELLKAIGKAYQKEKEIEKLIQLIADLEQAYITSRYLPAEFSQNQVKELKAFVLNPIKYLEKL
jgi:HEPN domain-containing protein